VANGITEVQGSQRILIIYDVFQDLKQAFFPKDKGRMQFIKSLKTGKWNLVCRTQNKPQ